MNGEYSLKKIKNWRISCLVGQIVSQQCSVSGYESKCNSQKPRPCCMLLIILTLCGMRLSRVLDWKGWCQRGYLEGKKKRHIKYRDICSCFQITLEKWVTCHTNADAFYYTQVIIKCSFSCGWWWKCESSLRGGKCFTLCRPQLTIVEQHHKPCAGVALHMVTVHRARVCKPVPAAL